MTESPADVIENRDRLGGSPGADLALACVAAGIRAADPAIGVRDACSLEGSSLTIRGETYDLEAYERCLVVGGGNAAGYAAVALEAVLGDRIDDGVVVTDNPVPTERIRLLPGDHPVPSERGVESTQELLAVADGATEHDFVIALVTGGGSALLAAPDGVGLEGIQRVTDELLASGATIHEMNAVRKHLSAIKGGRLARRLAPATTVGLLCSDVVGDDRSVIASGPLAPDPSTFADALEVVDTYGVDVGEDVERVLEDGADGQRAETPDEDDDCFASVRTHVVASNETATEAAATAARERGYAPLVLGSRLRGEATEVAKILVGVAESVRESGTPIDPPAVLVSGGESTVTLSGSGTGGPNHELALSAALELEAAGITLAAVDTDGIDGNSAAAGGLVTHETVPDRRAAREALASNDTAQFLADVGGSIVTGPTSTNVNDLHVVVVEADDASRASNGPASSR